MVIEPVLDIARPRKHFRIVDFPQPEGPFIKTFCPDETSSEKPSSKVLPSKAKDRFSARNAMSSAPVIADKIAGNRLLVKSGRVIAPGLRASHALKL
jgi:hypothetical protein